MQLNTRGHRVLRLARQMFAVGAFLICVSLLSAALGYHPAEGELFSPFNHSLSELGTYGLSALAVLANGGVFFGGLLLTLASLQGMRSVSGFGVLVWLTLAASWLALALSGLFPSNVYHLHTVALKWYFYFGLAATLGYLLWLALRSERPSSPLALGLCSVSLLFVSAFLVLPHLALESLPFNRPFYEEAYSPFPRPSLWWPAVLEWGSLLAMLLWQAELLRRPE
ncbi:hypothetical protein [Shewanella khirikhana]|uniref:DUF998 domain-containing protein n=1 Tax=Shewanella khirikhana TaxID=1965282 RepID=A0ABM7D045_9GAMM|nr:hypothetical protein [Shewanella khirikhana]AZQ09677.1 hypothetical protein STH12_00530 [Shewanella khirikhana]